MDRKEFIKTCGGACLALIGISVLEGCLPIYYVQGNISENKIQIKKTDFVKVNKDKSTYRKSVLIKTEPSNFPIVVYRYDDSNYSALLLECTHQGNELSVNGDILTCSAHGSEFSNKGEVITGPAEKKLKSYQVTTDEKNIYINFT